MARDACNWAAVRFELKPAGATDYGQMPRAR